MPRRHIVRYGRAGNYKWSEFTCFVCRITLNAPTAYSVIPTGGQLEIVEISVLVYAPKQPCEEGGNRRYFPKVVQYTDGRAGVQLRRSWYSPPKCTCSSSSNTILAKGSNSTYILFFFCFKTSLGRGRQSPSCLRR